MFNLFKKPESKIDRYHREQKEICDHHILTHDLQKLYNLLKKHHWTDDLFFEFVQTLVGYNGTIEIYTKNGDHVGIVIDDKTVKTRYL